MAYTTIKKPSDYFNTKLYNGTGSSNAVTGVGFQPDFTWIKRRNSATAHHLHNAISGATKVLNSNTTNAESTDAQKLSSFDSDGFTVGTNGDANNSAGTFASWNWLGANGTAANTDGSISSTVSANTTSGFSIVSYSGSNSNSTVGHGLGVAPRVIIIKRLNVADNWRVLHMSAGNDNTAHLNLTSAFSSSAVFQNTSPTSTVFSLVGNNTSVNQSGSTYIAYCFADVQGYSKFGSYTGNGSTDGTFVYTGFKPAFILVKQTNSTASWTILDNKRDSFNVTEKRLFPDDASAEVVSANGNTDFLSNGVKMRIGHANINASGSTYIYMAFAEEPLVGDNPCTAR